MTEHQKKILRFLRKTELSPAQLFMMWRHAQMFMDWLHIPVGGSVPESPEMVCVLAKHYTHLPMAPESSRMFSTAELDVVNKLAFNLPESSLRNGWAVLNYCVWERLFPESFHEQHAGDFLAEAGSAGDIAEWVREEMKYDGPVYAAIFDSLSIDVIRAVNHSQVTDQEFIDFLDSKKSKQMRP